MKLKIVSMMIILVFLFSTIQVVRPVTLVSASTSLYSDEFTATILNPNWTWVDPLGDCTHSLTANPGYLRISVPRGGNDLYYGSNYDAPRIIQSISGDFIIETRLLLDPRYNAQGAGILVWKDSDNYLRLQRLLCYKPRQVIDLQGEYAGSWSEYAETPYYHATTYLRLERTGDTFTASYSTDGVSWTVLHSRVLPVTDPLSIGLFIINQWQDNPIHGDFDYFRVTVPTVSATVDIDPDTLNLNSKGKWITAYIELPAGYDVSDTDVSTVMLNDQVSAESHPTKIRDYDDDGIADLMVKFNRSAVQDILEVGDGVEITVTGELTDGTPFEGSDTIRVIDKGKGK